MPANTNLHHCVAESLLGRRSRRNTPQVNAQEHGAYHRAVGFQPPCMTLRTLLHSAMRSNGHAVDPSVAQDLYDLLTPENWRQLYVHGTFLSPAASDAEFRRRAAIAAYHMDRFLLAEAMEVASAIGRLTGFSETHSAKGAYVFFRTNDPLDAMHRMVEEQTEQGAYKWVEPMCRTIRIQIATLTDTPQIAAFSHEQRQKLIDLLTQQQDRLAWRRTTVEPNVRDYAAELALLGGRGGPDMKQMD
ncbi:MAG: hypothetical protein PHO92_05630 [Candidatus Peribacteraceae bacterium]|nr:hypothetical protein [Candidatus Peribacteraceae bacterium]